MLQLSGGSEGKVIQQSSETHGINNSRCMLSTLKRPLILSSLLNFYRLVVSSSMLAKVASGYKQAIMPVSTPPGISRHSPGNYAIFGACDGS